LKVKLFKEKKIFSPKGNVLTYLKKDQKGYKGFGEIYFSIINRNKIKGWKKHKKMSMNIYVIIGSAKFVFYDIKKKKFSFKTLHEKKPQRLFIGPNTWFAFKNIAKKKTIIVNFSNTKHDDNEVLHKKLSEIKFNW
jgi:dTDP-4-dehydrorhamnose 3,5-epimerase